MTWVLGKPFVQDYALIIADVCVTLETESGTKEYDDCLLKIHNISQSNGLMVGFSGDVENAFKIIDDMRRVASEFALKTKSAQFDVLDFVQEWRKYVDDTGKHKYEDTPESGVHMLIAGNHTSKNSGGDKHPHCSVYQLKSPDYRPMPIHPFFWHHIGSGSGMEVCKSIVDEISNDVRVRLAAIDSTPEKYIEFLVPKISTLLENELKEDGVSPQLTIGISTPGSTVSAVTYSVDKPLPKLAASFEELQARFKNTSAKARFRA